MNKINSGLSLDFFKQDILQIEYLGNVLLDIDWYPQFDPDGGFQVRIIKNSMELFGSFLTIKSTDELIALIEKAQ